MTYGTGFRRRRLSFTTAFKYGRFLTPSTVISPPLKHSSTSICSFLRISGCIANRRKVRASVVDTVSEPAMIIKFALESSCACVNLMGVLVSVSVRSRWEKMSFLVVPNFWRAERRASPRRRKAFTSWGSGRYFTSWERFRRTAMTL